MSKALERVTPTRLDTDQLRYIAGSSFVPAHYRGKLPEIMACVATGRELGLGDMESLRQIYIVDGKPTMSAELMVKLARTRRHSISGTADDTKAVVTGKRADTGDEMTVTWTIEMADRAGLKSKENWQRYPEAMLWARAVSQLCRMLFPDVIGGVSYTPEELEVADFEELETDEPPVGLETAEGTETRDRPAAPLSPDGSAPSAPSPDEQPSLLGDDAYKELAEVAGRVEIANGKFKGKTLAERAALPDAESWFEYIAQRSDHPNYQPVLAYTRVHFPAVYAKHAPPGAAE